jgi:hypothetical protein
MFNELLPTNFHDDSRVWVYQASHAVSEEAAKQINEILHSFAAQWKSHGAPVKGWAALLFNRFVVLMADETATGVSGCSTDSSVHVVKAIDAQFQLDLFNRLNITFCKQEEYIVLPMNELQRAYDMGAITNQHNYFDNTVLTKAALQNNWLKPIGEGWLKSKLKTVVET